MYSLVKTPSLYLASMENLSKEIDLWFGSGSIGLGCTERSPGVCWATLMKLETMEKRAAGREGMKNLSKISITCLRLEI